MWVSLYYTSKPQQQTAISTNWCYLINFLMFFELEQCLSTHETLPGSIKVLMFTWRQSAWCPWWDARCAACRRSAPAAGAGPRPGEGHRGSLRHEGRCHQNTLNPARWKALKCYSPRMKAVVRQRCRDLAIIHETLEFSRCEALRCLHLPLTQCHNVRDCICVCGPGLHVIQPSDWGEF